MDYRNSWIPAAALVGGVAALMGLVHMGRVQRRRMHQDCIYEALRYGTNTVEQARASCSEPRW